MQKTQQYLKCLLIIGITVYVVYFTIIATYGHLGNPKPSDVAVVFGNQVYPGGEVSPQLKGRLDTAIQLYNDQLCENILVSGGVDPKGTDEAFHMMQYLLSKGIPKERIFVDSYGMNSYATIQNTKQLSLDNDWKSMILVSQYYHLLRTRICATLYGVENVTHYHADYYSLWDLYGMAREMAGIPVYLFKPYE